MYAIRSYYAWSARWHSPSRLALHILGGADGVFKREGVLVSYRHGFHSLPHALLSHYLRGLFFYEEAVLDRHGAGFDPLLDSGIGVGTDHDIRIPGLGHIEMK